MFTGRVPDLTRKLKQHALNIDTYLRNFEDSVTLILLELTQIEVVLNSLKRKLDRQSRKSVVQLLEDIRVYNIRIKGQNGLYQIFFDLNKIIGELEELQEDLKWER